MYEKNLIFIDTETTGVDEKDRLFQVAYDYNGTQKEELFLPPIPISIESSEVTHYTNDDIKNKKSFKESKFKIELEKIFQKKNTILVAHNAKFDIKMLKKEKIKKINSFIDTYKLAQVLDTQGKLNAYRLQYLRYALKLNIGKIPAHQALSDVIVLKSLFKRLYKKMKNDNPKKKDNEIIKKMIEISKAPILIKKFNFGKYKGLTVEEVAKKDIGYLNWLLKEKIKQENEDNEDWLFTLKQYIKQ